MSVLLLRALRQALPDTTRGAACLKLRVPKQVHESSRRTPVLRGGLSLAESGGEAGGASTADSCRRPRDTAASQPTNCHAHLPKVKGYKEVKADPARTSPPWRDGARTKDGIIPPARETPAPPLPHAPVTSTPKQAHNQNHPQTESKSLLCKPRPTDS